MKRKCFLFPLSTLIFLFSCTKNEFKDLIIFPIALETNSTSKMKILKDKFKATEDSFYNKTFDQVYSLSKEASTRAIPDALFLAQVAEQIAINSKNRANLAKVYWLTGWIYDLKGDLANAVNYYYGSAQIYETLKEYENVIKLYENAGTVALDNGIYEMALRAYKRRMEFSLKTMRSESLSKAHFDLGLVYKHMKEYSKSMRSFEESLQFIHAEGAISDSAMVSNIYNELGIVTGMTALEADSAAPDDSSMIYYNKALQFANSPINRFRTLNNIGNLYLRADHLTMAKDYFSHALLLSEQISNNRILIPTYNNLGIVHFKMGEYTIANSFFKKSIELNLKEYSIEETISDKANLIAFNNEHEFQISYEYIDTLSTLVKSDSYASMPVEKRIAERSLKHSEQLRNSVKVTLEVLEREISQKERIVNGRKNTEIFVLLAIFVILLYFLIVRLLKFLTIKKEIQREVARISEKYDV